MLKLDLIVDIGSSYTTIYEKNKGIVLKEPSLIAVRKVRNKLKTVSVGKDAARLAASLEIPKDVLIIYPFSAAVAVNPEAAVLMVKGFLETVASGRLIRPSFNIIATVSCGLSILDRKNYEKIFSELGIKDVTLVESPIAVANLLEAPVNTVAVIGSHLTELAVVGADGIITGCTVDICGTKLDEAVVKYVEATYRTAITYEKAEYLRRELGSLADRQQNTLETVGKSSVDDSKKRIDVTSEDIRIAVTPVFNKLVEVIKSVMSLVPPGVNAANGGVTVAGGIAATHGLGDFLHKKLNLPVTVLPDPNSVAIGGAKFFGQKAKLFRMLGINSED